MSEHDGPAALVTGGSRGIGREIAAGLAARGARVAVHHRGRAGDARAALASLPGEGHVLVQGDLAEAETARRVVDEAAEGLGGLDVLVNNAGIFEHHPPAETGFEAWMAACRRTLEVNLLGPAAAMHAAAGRMRAGGGGRIVNISSRGAFRGEPRAPAYGASKAGLNAMSQSLAQALAPDGIVVFVVAPGFVETEMAERVLDGPEGDSVRAQSPFGRVARPEEVARAAVMLALDAPAFMSGDIVDVNGASYLR